MRIAGVVQQGAERLRSQHRPGDDQRNRRARFAGAGSRRTDVPAGTSRGARDRTSRLVATAAILLRVLDGEAGGLATTSRPLCRMWREFWRPSGLPLLAV